MFALKNLNFGFVSTSTNKYPQSMKNAIHFFQFFLFKITPIHKDCDLSQAGKIDPFQYFLPKEKCLSVCSIITYSVSLKNAISLNKVNLVFDKKMGTIDALIELFQITWENWENKCKNNVDVLFSGLRKIV